MNKHLKYLRYIIRHKWFVFQACWKEGIVWRGITHDLSKFCPSEWAPYAKYFYDPQSVKTGDAAFDFAWLLHQKRNRHHWQWWVLPEDDGGLKVLPMGPLDRLEMICDWRGAGKAQGKPDTLAWYLKHSGQMLLHPETREGVENALGMVSDL